MLINGFNLIHYLLGKGFINYQDLFCKGISITPVQSRNFSYKVTIPDSTFLFVKQVDFPEPDKVDTLKMEATCYWLAQHENTLHALREVFPDYIHFDPYHHILISEQIPDSTDLQTYFKSESSYSVSIAKKLGKILATYHNGMYEKIVQNHSERLFRQAVPSPFSLFGEHLPRLKPRSDVEKQMRDLILSEPSFKERVREVKQKWDVTSLIHGDIKFQNFLIDLTGDHSIRLIDWEVADLGDPLWDCAAILQSYILPWIFNLDQKNVPQLYQSMEVSIPSIHAFWEEYRDSTSHQSANLIKLIEYCAIKLLHTCYESHVQAPALGSSGVKLLQLSLNMLTNPQNAITQFFEFKTFSHAAAV